MQFFFIAKKSLRVRAKHTWDEVISGELSGELLHGKDHLVNLPLEAVVQIQLREKIHHVRVRSEKDVQALKHACHLNKLGRKNKFTDLLRNTRYDPRKELASFSVDLQSRSSHRPRPAKR
jgi:hypothetical protein